MDFDLLRLSSCGMHESGGIDAKISGMAGHIPGRLLPRAWAENRARWAARSAQGLVWAGERAWPRFPLRLCTASQGSLLPVVKEATFNPCVPLHISETLAMPTKLGPRATRQATEPLKLKRGPKGQAYEPLSVLGRGAFGTAYLVRRCPCLPLNVSVAQSETQQDS